MVRPLFGRKLFERFKLDSLFVSRAYEFLYRGLRRTNVWYNFRSDAGRDARSVFNVKHNGRRVTPEDRIWAHNFLLKKLNLTESKLGRLGYDAIVVRVRNWVNSVVRYRVDKKVFGLHEFWACPINMLLWLEEDGFIYDDCDGFACLMCECCILLGVPQERCLVRAGFVFDKKGKEFGHATFYYAHSLWNNWFAVEGSFYKRELNRRFGLVPVCNLSVYSGGDWFFVNRFRSYVRR